MEETPRLSSITFKAKYQQADDFKVRKERFPIASNPTVARAIRNEVSFTIDMSYSVSVPSSKVNISRPRNQFILARMILSKLVKIVFKQSNNETISKVISIIWSREIPEFKRYFKYLSNVEEVWHEIYYPNYYYQPKKLVKGPSKLMTDYSVSVSPTPNSDIFGPRGRQAVIVSNKTFKSEGRKSGSPFQGSENFAGSKNNEPSGKPEDMYHRLCSSAISLKPSEPPEQGYSLTVKKFKIEKPWSIKAPTTQRPLVVKKREKRAANKSRFRNVDPVFYRERIEDICI